MRFTACAHRFFFREKHDPTEFTFYPSRVERHIFALSTPRGGDVHPVIRTTGFPGRVNHDICSERPGAIGIVGSGVVGGGLIEMIKCIYTRAHAHNSEKRKEEIVFFFPHCRAYVYICLPECVFCCCCTRPPGGTMMSQYYVSV